MSDHKITVSIHGIDEYPSCPRCGQTAYWRPYKPGSKTNLSQFPAGVRSLGPERGQDVPKSLIWSCDQCGNVFCTPVEGHAHYLQINTKDYTTRDLPADWPGLCSYCGSPNTMPAHCDGEANPAERLCEDCNMYSGGLRDCCGTCPDEDHAIGCPEEDLSDCPRDRSWEFAGNE